MVMGQSSEGGIVRAVAAACSSSRAPSGAHRAAFGAGLALVLAASSAMPGNSTARGRSCTESTWAMFPSLCHDLSFPVTKTSRGTGHRRSQGSGSGDPAFMRRACCSRCCTSVCTHVGMAAGGLDGTVCSAEGPGRSTGSSHPTVASLLASGPGGLPGSDSPCCPL